MNILFLSYDLPFPLDAGGKIRSYYLIKELSKKYTVHLWYFYRDKKARSYEDKLKSLCATIRGYKRRSKYSPEILPHLVKFPYPAALYYSSKIQHDLSNFVKEQNISIVQYESFYTSCYINHEITIPQVLGTENVEWRLYDEYTQKKKQPLKSILNFEVQKIRSFEKNSWKKTDACFAVSHENKSEIAEETDKSVYLIKNGVDTSYFAQKAIQNKKVKEIVFVGNYIYIQNQNAAFTLVTVIAPQLPSAMHIRLVGKNAPHRLLALVNKTPRVTIDTTVDDIRSVYKTADLLVAPIELGSGTKFKILEAMAAGVPVITSPLGIEGIDASSEAVHVVKNSHDMVQHILSLSDDIEKRTRMAAFARTCVEEKYSWDTIGIDLRNAYEDIIHHHR